MKTGENGPKLIVFYNTKCPICDAGINAQQNKLIGLVKSGQVEFRDINLEPNALAEFNITVDDIRKKLHAFDQSGALLIGADVAISLWEITPDQKWFARLFGNRLTIHISRIGYNILAEILWRWNKLHKRW